MLPTFPRAKMRKEQCAFRVFLCMFGFLLFLLVLAIAGGFWRSYTVNQSPDQQIFLKGTYPNPALDGPYKGSVKGWSGSWQGKQFTASGGINVFDDNGKEVLKYPFHTYKAHGLTDSIEVLKIDYATSQNPWWLRPILDEVVQVEPGTYLGKMQARIIPGFPFTVTFFRLVKPVHTTPVLPATVQP